MRRLPSLPILCSIAALTFSLLGVLAATGYRFHFSFSLILLAAFFDMLDGHLARRLKQESDLGAALDLLQDSVNYLLYPCIVFFSLGFRSLPGIAVLCVFFACGCWRLARFSGTGLTAKDGKPGYQGMPVFYSHAGVLTVMFLPPPYVIPFLFVWLPLLSALMISTIHFHKPRSLILWGGLLLLLSLYFLWR